MHPGSRPLSNQKFERFAQFYKVKRNAADAARKAGYSEKSARFQGHELLTKPNIKARIDFLESELLAQADMDAKEVIEWLVSIVRADPNELIQIRTGACRYCHGKQHQYQWRTKREYETAKGEWDRRPKKWKEDNPDAKPLSEGGYGYKRTNTPHLCCPECDGFGLHFIVAKDSTRLSPLGRRLYAGVKETQHGIEIKTHDQMKALAMLAQITKAMAGPAEAVSDLAAALHEINHMPSAAPIRTPGLLAEDDEDDATACYPASHLGNAG